MMGVWKFAVVYLKFGIVYVECVLLLWGLEKEWRKCLVRLLLLGLSAVWCG